MKFLETVKIITPLTIIAFVAFCASIYGLINSNRHENYDVLNLILGLPILIISMLFHVLFQWYFQRNIRSIWIIETVFIVIIVLGFVLFSS